MLSGEIELGNDHYYYYLHLERQLCRELIANNMMSQTYSLYVVHIRILIKCVINMSFGNKDKKTIDLQMQFIKEELNSVMIN